MSRTDNNIPYSKKVYDKTEQYIRAEIIVDTVCEVAGLSWLQLINPKAKNLTRNIAIGIIALLSWDYGVHPLRIGAYIHRSRTDMINQKNRYFNYVRAVGNRPSDQLTMHIYKESKAKLEAIFGK